jgi:hypothetical protein
MRRALCTATVFASLLIAPAASHAAKPWGAAETVSRAPGAPAVALGLDGRGAIGWGAKHAMYGARRSATRGFGQPFSLYREQIADADPAVALDRDGNALFAFRRLLESNHRILAATLRPSGSRTSAFSLSGPGSSANNPAFATPPAGTLSELPTLAWWRREGPPGGEPNRVQFARSVGGRLLAADNDTLPGAAQASYAELPDGSVVAATTALGVPVIATRPPGGVLSAPQPVSSNTRSFWGADVATGPDGTVAVAWRDSDGGINRIFVAVRRPGATAFDAPVLLSVARDRAQDPSVVVTLGGVVRVAYLAVGITGTPSGGGRLLLATPGEPKRTVTPAGQLASDFDIAADGRGGVTLAWTRREPGHGGGAAFARAARPDGVLGSIKTLTAPGERALDLDLAAGVSGEALVAWQSGSRVRAAYRPRS